MLLLACFIYVQAQPLQKPNIIFIVADDIGYDVPAVYGGQSFSTPNIDSMARHGISFTHCESSPMCSPSRVMLLTGKQNVRNYCNWGFLSDTATTIGNLMRDAGYNTGFFGKLELPCNTARMQNWGWNEYTLFDMMDDTSKNGNRYKTPNLIDKNGRVADSIINGKYCDDIVVSRLENFIENNNNKPFFAYYAMSLCHSPFSPTPDDPQYAGWDPAKEISDTSYFPSMVKYMDKKVGEILSRLNASGLSNNTIVIFTADNPTPNEIYYYANGKKVQGGKTKTKESGTHVPLIAYMPQYIAANTVNDDLIDFTDFFPTLAGLARFNNLSSYGALDGVSFYRRLFNGAGDSLRSYIFSHYDPHPGSDEDTLKRWVRDKNYKLYDFTDTKTSGKFYNIINDPDEKKPVADKNLTAAETALKNTFKHILDTSATWPAGAVITNATVTNITSSSVVLSADITATGATALMERGTNLSTKENPYYYDHNFKDPVIALGSFSQKRDTLLPQKQYYYSLYAMNKNASNNTAYALGTFYTFSNPPVQQAASLKALKPGCATIKLTWDSAVFPSAGASKAGYLVFYSSSPVVLNNNVNGKPPTYVCANASVKRINLQSKLPALPPTSVTIKNLSADTLYYFTLVPYTCSGNADKTFNYLTSGAPTTNKQPNACNKKLSASDDNNAVAEPLITISPNPSDYTFSLKINTALAGEQVAVKISDEAGITYLNTIINAKSNYSFGENLKPGAYIVYISTANKNYTFKILKQ